MQARTGAREREPGEPARTARQRTHPAQPERATGDGHHPDGAVLQHGRRGETGGAEHGQPDCGAHAASPIPSTVPCRALTGACAPSRAVLVALAVTTRRASTAA